MLLLSTLVFASAEALKPGRLPQLQISREDVVIVGFDHSADFAHQFHIAFSSIVSGSCIFSGQPFHCAASHFAQDSSEVKTPWTRVPNCDGCLPLTTVPFDHCKKTPRVVDVGSLVDYPRRHCGENPITRHECIDAVEYFLQARVFAFNGQFDDVYLPGAVENTVALLAQMLTDPETQLQFVANQPFGHTLPLNSTPHVNSTTPAGYDGPGECLRHVLGSSLSVSSAIDSSWLAFDQKEFSSMDVGFQEYGWIYVPKVCKSASCKLVIRPDTCRPPTGLSPDLAEFAKYAEGSGIVLLCPCLGGNVDKFKYPHAHDVEQGKLDVFGQLSSDYVQQSAPHMKAIGKMLRRVLGISATPSNGTAHREKLEAEVDSRATPRSEDSSEMESAFPGLPEKLPSLKINRSFVMTAGCSNTADFSHQFHVAFSSLVTGSCIFSGQPFRCAVTRFPGDYMVPKAPSTASGIHCPDCPENGTLVYDHCKNHPHWVNVSMLTQYAETASNVDNPKKHLSNARVFAFRPTHDRCYGPGSMELVADFHRRYAKSSLQVKLVRDQPFPHTLPTNSTPYFNHSDPAGYDGPGECLRHVFGHAEAIIPALPSAVKGSWKMVDVREFVTDSGVGLFPWAWLFLPPPCKEAFCKLLILPGGCPPIIPPSGSADDFARYAMVNNIVILKPCAGRPADSKRFPDNHENLRGLLDVYGQLSAEYATQKGSQMEPIGKMLRRLLGLDSALYV